MGQVLHGSARTTEAVRRAIQHSEESLRALAKRHGINQKTVAKWKKRETVADRPAGPTDPRSTVLSLEEEAIIVAFDLGQSANPMPLKAAVQGRARQVRDGRLKRIEAVIKRQERVPAEGNHDGLLLDREHA